LALNPYRKNARIFMSEFADLLAGEWAGAVLYGPKAEKFTLTFDNDGTVALTSDGTTGQGGWSPTGANTFDLEIREKLNVGDSGVSGDTMVTGIDHLIISVSAKLSGPAFGGAGIPALEGAGKARVYDADGGEIFAIDALLWANQRAAS
jgi:hypothetical protein